MDPLSTSDIKLERKDSDEDQLMIDDEEFVDELNIEDPTDDTNDDQVRLEKLPRPVNELNCRQARTFLVKLLRAANGGQNPHYGNPESKPPFWPDYYWPWSRLFDVHTKPRGMNEPLQYSEMMKLAIGRGYQYFGYDPNTYVRPEGEPSPIVVNAPTRILTMEIDPLMSGETVININDDPFIESDEFDGSKYYLKQPPRLPRPLSKVNCVQARTALAKLLRYQQCGNNPVYGSPDTEPPWWPNNLIRWVDMVDLRGKPPYLPDTKSYTDVLKIAIGQAYAYYGYDPESYLDICNDVNDGLLGTKQKMFPVIPAAGIAPPPPPRVMGGGNIARIEPPANNMDSSFAKENAIGDDLVDDDDEEMGDLPPKLPMPVGKMNCSVTRTCLAKLIRFHCGRGQLPNYGNPASMPVWWPNHIIDWTKIKNLSHRYEGYLGNTYSNCLRIAMIRGYAHYGLDANEYVERKGIRDPYQPIHKSSPLEQLALNGNNTASLVIPPPRQEKSGFAAMNGHDSPMPMMKRPVPMLIPLSSLVSEGQYPQSLLDTRDWFPPRLAYSKAIDCPAEAVQSLKPCKVILDSTKANSFSDYSLGPVREETRIAAMFDFFKEDLVNQKYTDITLVATKRSPKHPKENYAVKVHKLVLAAHSRTLRYMIKDLNEDDPVLVLSGITGPTLDLLVEALYTGTVILTGKDQLNSFEAALTCLHSFGILLNLRPVLHTQTIVQDTLEISENDMIELDLDSIVVDDAEVKQEAVEEEPLITPGRPKRGGKTDVEEQKSPEQQKPPGKKRGRPPASAKAQESTANEEQETQQQQKRRRRNEDSSKPEKPNFDNLTSEVLKEKVNEGQMAFVEWLQSEGFLKKTPPHCALKECQSKTKLVADEDDIDGVVWQCSSGKDHGTVSVRVESVFDQGGKKSAGAKDSLSWIIQIIQCWSENTSLMHCQELTGADVDKIFFWYDECRDYYGAL